MNRAAQSTDAGPATVTVEHDPVPTADTPEEEEDVVDEDPVDTADPFVHDGPVTEISGIGPSYSERLADAGITTIGELANADIESLAANADLSEKRVQDWVDAAQELASSE